MIAWGEAGGGPGNLRVSNENRVRSKKLKGDLQETNFSIRARLRDEKRMEGVQTGANDIQGSGGSGIVGAEISGEGRRGRGGWGGGGGGVA